MKMLKSLFWSLVEKTIIFFLESFFLALIWNFICDKFLMPRLDIYDAMAILCVTGIIIRHGISEKLSSKSKG